jgi:hypothetical protein
MLTIQQNNSINTVQKTLKIAIKIDIPKQYRQEKILKEIANVYNTEIEHFQILNLEKEGQYNSLNLNLKGNLDRLVDMLIHLSELHIQVYH